MRDQPAGSPSQKVALVTGASSGVGAATALAFAQQGTRVVVTARRADRLESLVERIRATGGEATAVPGDATLPETARAAVAECLDKYGSLHFLINNAGVGTYKQLVDTSIADYDEIMDANMKSCFLFSREAAPHLVRQRSGTIVFVSSVSGLRGASNEAVYCAAKFAQVGFAQSLDEELRPFGIKVCTLCPGGIKTEFALGRGRTPEGVAASRMMEASEVADAITWLCSQPQNVRVLQTTIRNMGEQK